MDIETLLTGLDRFGVFVFAFSGGLLAAARRMDLLGVCLIALLPAIGGGTLRDVLLDQPVFWLDDPLVVGLAIAGGLTAFLVPNVRRSHAAIVWADALGLSAFAALGAARTWALGFDIPIVIVMGTISATAGGLVRDVVCNEVPLLLSEDVYATAAILGASAYCLIAAFGPGSAAALGGGVLVTLIVRAAGIVFRLGLPRPRLRGD